MSPEVKQRWAMLLTLAETEQYVTTARRRYSAVLAAFASLDHTEFVEVVLPLPLPCLVVENCLTDEHESANGRMALLPQLGCCN